MHLIAHEGEVRLAERINSPLKVADLIVPAFMNTPYSLKCVVRHGKHFAALLYDPTTHTYGLLDLPNKELHIAPKDLELFLNSITRSLMMFSVEELHHMVMNPHSFIQGYSFCVKVLLSKVSQQPDVFFSPLY